MFSIDWRFHFFLHRSTENNYQLIFKTNRFFLLYCIENISRKQKDQIATRIIWWNSVKSYYIYGFHDNLLRVFTGKLCMQYTLEHKYVFNTAFIIIMYTLFKYTLRLNVENVVSMSDWNFKFSQISIRIILRSKIINSV